MWWSCWIGSLRLKPELGLPGFAVPAQKAGLQVQECFASRACRSPDPGHCPWHRLCDVCFHTGQAKGTVWRSVLLTGERGAGVTGVFQTPIGLVFPFPYRVMLAKPILPLLFVQRFWLKTGTSN